MNSKRPIVIGFIFLIFATSVGLLIYYGLLQASDIKFSFNAAIIDQLAGEFPNPTFAANVTTVFAAGGFKVSCYNKSLDVEFFNGLAKSDYGIIILRAHSALREDNSTVDIFTSEEFSEYRHQQQLQKGLLVPGLFYWAPEKLYFAFTSDFVRSLEGSFPKSIVIAMGCWSLKPGLEQMAKAFIDKGAIAYIGWTNAVLANDTDYETYRFVRSLFENKTLSEAVSQTNAHQYITDKGIVTTRMALYPASASELKLGELAADATTPALMKANYVAMCACFLSTRVSEGRKRPETFAYPIVNELPNETCYS